MPNRALELPDYRASTLEAGERGDWTLRKVDLPAGARRDGNTLPDCFRFRPGRYTELRCGGVTYMTDLYDEWWTQAEAIRQARRTGGRVLITGLGLGLVVEAILAEPALAPVQKVTILERSPDVIALVSGHLQRAFGARVEVIQADAFSWQADPVDRFDTVWHDIWPDPMAAEVDQEIEQLRAQHADWSQWQGFWPLEYRRALSAT